MSLAPRATSRAPRRRGRRGRGPRGPLAWPAVPAMVSPSERFDELVVEAAERAERRWGQPFPPFQIGVEEVPPSDPAPWEEQEVPLGRVFGEDGTHPARVVIYRRPIETRAPSTDELAAIIEEVVTEQIASVLGVDPERLEDGPDA